MNPTSPSPKFYSQNQEDFYIASVMEQQKLDVPPLVVEIGACDGIHLSNSRHFVEHCRAFPKARTMQAAITDTSGPVAYFEVPGKPDQNFVDAADHPKKQQVKDKCDARIVNGITWVDALASTVLLDVPVGILSIDAEGCDTAIARQVIKTAQCHTCGLPAWIVIESHSQTARRQQLELLTPYYHLLNVLDFNLVFVRRDVAAKWIPVE